MLSQSLSSKSPSVTGVLTRKVSVPPPVPPPLPPVPPVAGDAAALGLVESEAPPQDTEAIQVRTTSARKAVCRISIAIGRSAADRQGGPTGSHDGAAGGGLGKRLRTGTP